MKDLLKVDISLIKELSILIEQAQNKVVSYANSSLTFLFWQVGKRINDEILNNDRAEYGKQIISTVSIQLVARFGRNFEEKNLRRMIQFAQVYPSSEIVVSLSRQLTWSHILVLLPLKSDEARLFYAQLIESEHLSVRELRKQIETKTFERVKIANIQVNKSELLPINTFKDPYIFDFLGLKNDYLEKDLEFAVLRELEMFILEMGKGFSFIERQKRMIIDGEDFYLDLLFFHRKLRRLVAVELKLGKFKAQDKGQMELYLNWLNKYERQEFEEAPIGLILCAENSKEQVELLKMHKDGIMVAEY